MATTVLDRITAMDLLWSRDVPTLRAAAEMADLVGRTELAEAFNELAELVAEQQEIPHAAA